MAARRGRLRFVPRSSPRSRFAAILSATGNTQITASDTFTWNDGQTEINATTSTTEGTLTESSAVTQMYNATDSFSFTDTGGNIQQAITDSWSGADSSSLDTGSPPVTGDGYQAGLPTFDVSQHTYSTQVLGSTRLSQVGGESRTSQDTGAIRITLVGPSTRLTMMAATNVYSSQVAGTTRTTQVGAAA